MKSGELICLGIVFIAGLPLIICCLGFVAETILELYASYKERMFELEKKYGKHRVETK